jgi:hypothetical protein
VRAHDEGDLGQMAVDEFAERVAAEAAAREA